MVSSTNKEKIKYENELVLLGKYGGLFFVQTSNTLEQF